MHKTWTMATSYPGSFHWRGDDFNEPGYEVEQWTGFGFLVADDFSNNCRLTLYNLGLVLMLNIQKYYWSREGAISRTSNNTHKTTFRNILLHVRYHCRKQQLQMQKWFIRLLECLGGTSKFFKNFKIFLVCKTDDSID